MPASARPPRRLLIFGGFYLDLVFYDLPGVPRLGEEVKTRRFAELPGGGLATTALVAAGLGTATAAVTRVGGEASLSPTLQKLTRSRVSVEADGISSNISKGPNRCATSVQEP